MNRENQVAPVDRISTCPGPSRWLAGVVLLVGALLGVLPLRTPPPANDAPADRFSAGRALDHVETLAQSPRPLGTAGHERARRYLVESLEAAGAEARVQQEIVVRRPSAGFLEGYRIHNVVGRLEGSAGTDQAILLSAHYDTVQGSPGASDDGAGVASWLEVVRALESGPPSKNDLIVLFSDGEELGLHGARAFAERHPWAEDVRLAVNLEARGTRGPALLFETGAGTGPLLEIFDEQARHPVATSVSQAIYRRMPNDTDFSLFRDGPGFNLAYFDGSEGYHSPLDRVEEIHPGSLQHLGDNSLALVRHFAGVDLERLPTGAPTSYFNLPVGGLVVYPAAWELPAAAALAVLWIVLAALAFRRRLLRPGRLLLALAAPLGAALAAFAGAFLVHQLTFGVLGRTTRMLGDGKAYLAAVLVLAAALAWLVLAAVHRRTSPLAMAAGATLLWTVLALLMAASVPGAGYLFVWPAGFGLVAMALLLLAPPRAACWSVPLCALPAAVLWAPVIVLVAVSLGAQASAMLAALLALLLALLVPHLAPLGRGPSRSRLLPLAALAAGLVLVAAVVATADYSSRWPRPASLVYGLDSDTGEAVWASLEAQPNAWSAPYLGSDATWTQGPDLFAADPPEMLVATAPAIDAPAPTAELVTTAADPEGGRRATLRLVAPGAAALQVKLRSTQPLRVLEVAGQPVGAPESGAADEPQDEWSLLFQAPPEGGFEVVVALPDGAPLEAVLVSRFYGLPELPGYPTEGPPEVMPHSHRPADWTLVRNHVELAEPPAQAGGTIPGR